MRTIKIIGGGLAGLSLGIALSRRQVPVLVQEAGTYPRHRVCGEFISGLQDRTMVELGVEGCFADAAILREVAWYDHRRQLRSDRLPAPAMGLSRWVLDDRLASRLREVGAELEVRTREDREKAHAGRVDCAGRRSARQSPWLGLKCHLGAFHEGADLEMHMSPHGYVGICRVENNQYNLCGLFRKAGLKPRRGQPLIFDYLHACGFKSLLERMDSRDVVPGSECSVAAMSYQPADVRGGGLQVGDAQGLIPPFTGNGMTMAFEHASLALHPLLRYARGETGWADCRQQVDALSQKQFGRRLLVARGLHRMLTSEKLFPVTTRVARLPLFPFQSFYHLTR